MLLPYVRATIALLLFALAAVGCGSGESLPTVPASGTITLGGQPVEGASVTFVPKSDSGRPASGTTDASGKFKLQSYLSPSSSPAGALPGDYTVTVAKLQAAGAMTPDEMAKQMGGGKGAAMAGPKHLLPEKYSTSQSGLTATVKAGDKNDFSFDLQKE
jgi:hypothetical protein